MTFHGTCDDRFALVGQNFGSSLESGDDVGASVAVILAVGGSRVYFGESGAPLARSDEGSLDSGAAFEEEGRSLGWKSPPAG